MFRFAKTIDKHLWELGSFSFRGLGSGGRLSRLVSVGAFVAFAGGAGSGCFDSLGLVRVGDLFGGRGGTAGWGAPSEHRGLGLPGVGIK